MSEKLIFISGGNQARRLSVSSSSTRRVDSEVVRNAFGQSERASVKAGVFPGSQRVIYIVFAKL